MKIVAPFLSLSEIEPLLKAGANELYTAVPGVPSFTEGCLRGSPAAAFTKIHALGGKALVAANSMHLVKSPAALRALVRRLLALEEAGADAFIISSPSLLSALRKERRRPKAALHLSSVQPCFNSAALRFFLRLGVNRLILPGQLAPAEAKEIFRVCRAEGVETEIFDYRFFGCSYVNGRCGLHVPVFHNFREGVPAGSLCGVCGGRQVIPVRPLDVNRDLTSKVPALARRVAVRMGCGGTPRIYNAASFYDFFRLGAGWLKYGIRADSAAVKARKVAAMREMVSLAGELTAALGPAAARAEFIRRMTAGWQP